MTFHSPFVLIAEHQDAEWETIRRILVELEIRPLRARNGASAIGLVAKSRREDRAPDLMLIDTRVPLMDALGVARCVRALGVSAEEMPIIALGDCNDDEVAACVDAGMQWHLTRPFQPDALAAVIRRWTGRPPPGPAAPLPWPHGRPSAIEPLIPAFVRRCDRCGDCVSRLLARLPELPEALVVETRDYMHKLAGSSALFDEAGLGDAARAVETALRALDDHVEPTRPTALHATLRDFLSTLAEARRSSGMWAADAV